MPGIARQAAYRGGGGARSNEVTAGVSVGWADVYEWFLPGQYIDITDAPPGRYRLQATVDPLQPAGKRALSVVQAHRHNLLQYAVCTTPYKNIQRQQGVGACEC